jgi:hypothetical protein
MNTILRRRKKMADEERLPEEEVVTGELDVGEELPPEEPLPEEEVTPEGGEGPAEVAGTILSHTLEEMPEAEGLQINDEIVLRVNNITEDGTYEFEVQRPVAEEPLVEEGGREELTQALL